MRVIARVLAMTALAVAFGLVATGAMAQCGSGIIYQDRFQTLDPYWGVQAGDAEVSVQDGSLILKPEAGYERYVLNQANFYGDATVCVDVTIAETASEEQSWAGILFWAAGYPDFYAFEISTFGSFAVFRRSNSKWLIPIDWTFAEAGKQGIGATNKLEVRLKGKRATFFINDQQVAQINGFPPEGGSLVGLTGSSPTESSATFQFKNFTVGE